MPGASATLVKLDTIRHPVELTSDSITRLPEIAAEVNWRLVSIDCEFHSGRKASYEEPQQFLRLDQDHIADLEEIKFYFRGSEGSGFASLDFKPARSWWDRQNISVYVSSADIGMALAIRERLELFCKGLMPWYGLLARSGIWWIVYFAAQALNLLWSVLHLSRGVPRPSVFHGWLPDLVTVAIAILPAGLYKRLFPLVAIRVGNDAARRSKLRQTLLRRSWELFLIGLGAALNWVFTGHHH